MGKVLNWWIRLNLNYPYVVLIVQFILFVACVVTCVIVGSQSSYRPNFHDPKLGFETRGTYISNRVRTYERLLEDTLSSLSRFALKSSVDNGIDQTAPPVSDDKQSSQDDDEDVDRAEHLSVRNSVEQDDPFFCDDPRVEYAKVVFESTTGDSLWTSETLKLMCDLEERVLRSQPSFISACVCQQTNSHECYRSWSAGNYVALLANKSSCSIINDDDALSVLTLLQRCMSSFRENLNYPSQCWHSDLGGKHDGCDRKRIPKFCRKPYSAVYHLLYHIVDSSFLQSKVPHLKYAVTFLPIAAGLGSKDLYYDITGLSRNEWQNSAIRLVALDFGLKQDLFDHHLILDTVWFGCAIVCVFVVVFIYTKSLLVTVCTFLVILFSLAAAYLTYTFVFGIRFFPFLNLLACLVLVGIGVDDMFVYIKIWSRTKATRDSMTPERLVMNSFLHSTPSAFASSSTTAGAFIAGALVSKITVLRCFGIFAGIAVVVHFFILAMTVPAVIIISYRFCASVDNFVCCRRRCCCCCSNDCGNAFADRVETFFSHTLPQLASRLRFVFVSILGAVGTAALFAVFVYPRLQLPTSSEFQLFTTDHPFEIYDLKLKQQFIFARASGQDKITFPLTVVWGLIPSDNGDHWNPLDRNELKTDDNFDIGSLEARHFLTKFCQRLRKTKFYLSQPGFQLTNCFIENFDRFMKRGCEDIDGHRLEPCCGYSRPSYSSETFHRCLEEYLPDLYQSSFLYPVSRDAGLRFDRSSGRVVAVVVDFQSNELFSLNYTSVGNFLHEVESFVSTELNSAPVGLRNGFFTSYLSFYDLQHAIASGTTLAIGIAVGIAAIIALLTTFNFVLTLFAMLTVFLAICVTVAALICLGWQLNVVESVTISVAVGLSVDFSLHHSVAYRLADPKLDRRQRVLSASCSVATPVAMSAVTTFLVGALLMPSKVLAYQQLGTFLMLVTGATWLYTTFFLQALLCIAGPNGSFGQLTWFLVKVKDLCCQEMSSGDLSRRSQMAHRTQYVADSSQSSSGDWLDSQTDNKPKSSDDSLEQSDTAQLS